jgi:hypothetical protein
MKKEMKPHKTQTKTFERTKDAAFVTPKQKDNRINTGSPFNKKEAKVPRYK